MDSLRYAAQRLRESLFLLPAAVIAVCIGAAGVARSLDRDWSALGDFPLLLSVSVSGGRSVAIAVAGATITVAAIVFSMTALSSQIASSQYSPRAVAGFFEDRFQQVVIGLAVGTFAYSLLVVAGLAGIADSDQGLHRSVSVTLAVILGIGTAVAIVAYIDHSLRRMRVSAVVRRIAEATLAAIGREYRREESADHSGARAYPDGQPIQVRADRTGWVRFIDAPRLAASLPPATVARIEVRVGELVAAGDLVATIWRASGRDNPTLARAIRRVIHTGRARSVIRDPAFGIRQLADIALRALSPGINDPTTAVDVIQHMKAPLRAILAADPPGRVHEGPEAQRVFLPEAPSRSDHVHAAFSEIRLAAAGQPTVLRALLEVCGDLLLELREADHEARGAALVEEAGLALGAARAGGFPGPDLERVVSAATHLGIDSPDEPGRPSWPR